MDNAGLGGEVERLRQKLGEPLCAECPYARPPVMLEAVRIVYPDGSEDIQRDPRDTSDEPVQLCGRCPYAPGAELEDKRPLRFVEFVRTVRSDAEEGA
jgi:hypothetical protein